MKKIVMMLCVVWMGFIFSNSMEVGQISQEKSFGFVKNIKSEYQEMKGISESKVNEGKKIQLPTSKRDVFLNFLVRKGAHAFEFCILDILLTQNFVFYGFRKREAFFYALFICLFYAVLDEYHQIFVPNRTSSVKDILFDFVGSIMGAGIQYIIYFMGFLWEDLSQQK